MKPKDRKGEKDHQKPTQNYYQRRRRRFITIISVIVLVIFLGYTILGTLLSAVYAEEEGWQDEERMRGIWVSTISSLDYPKEVTTEEAALKQQADEILDGAKALGMNAVFLQVSPSADALYDSSYFPWSRYLTGQQGIEPENGFDPLEYWVKGAHDRGMELHAWINPYRVTKYGDSEYEELSEDSPAKLNQDWVVKCSGNYYFNPAVPEVRRLVTDAAVEIVENYDVDGIHMDDYFYPSVDFDDAASYEKYGGDFDDIGDFRRDSVDQLIRMLDEELHKAKKDISFGVSPFGIWANDTSRSDGSATSGKESYFDHYADTVGWAEEGIVDYLAPQVYWNIGFAAADYSVLVEWWSEALKDTDTELYIGLADYKAVQASDTDDVWYGTAELERQMDLNRTYDKIGGEIHFRYWMIQEDDDIPAFLSDYYGVSPGGEEDEKDSDQDSGNSGVQDDEGDLTDKDKTDEEQETTLTFSDVKEGDWYYEAVSYVSRRGLMNGTSDILFSPGSKVSRAMTVTILYRLAGQPAVSANCGFDDVERGSWYEKAVIWASENGIVNGYSSGNFGPYDNITREQMAAVFCRYAKSRGIDVTQAGKNVNLGPTSSAIRDGGLVSPYAQEAMKWAVGSGLISGRGNGLLDPAGTASRAEAAQILMNFCEKIAG